MGVSPGEDRQVERVFVKLRGKGSQDFAGGVLVRSERHYLVITCSDADGKLFERYFSHQDIFEYFVYLEPSK